MVRFISFLFLLTGLAAAAYGGARLAGIDLSRYGLDPIPVVTTPTNKVEEGTRAAVTPPLTSASVEPAPVVETARSNAVLQPMTAPTAPETIASTRTARAPEPRFDATLDRNLPSAAIAEESQKQADRQSFLERLYNVPVAYETPKYASYRKPFEVTFAVDATGDITAADALPGEDTNIVETSAKISDRIKANLAGGSAFQIKLQSPEIQRVSILEENVWRWQVMPIEAGEHTLILELFALEEDEAIPVRTLNDKVEVSVSAFQQVVSFADHANPLFVVLGGIGSAIGGFFGFFRFFASKRRA